MVKLIKLIKHKSNSSKHIKLAMQIKKLQQLKHKSQLHKSRTNSKIVSRKSKIIQPDVHKLIIPETKKHLASTIIKKSISSNRKSTSRKKNHIGGNNHYNYVIAIPSYKRQDIIQTHTLAVLKRHNINPKCITIFVASQEECDIYKEALPSLLYNNLVIGELGLKNQRNIISKYYPEGKHVVEMDDDIKSIMQLVVKNQSIQSRSKSRTKSRSKSKKIVKIIVKKTVKPIEDLDSFIRNAFKMSTEKNIFLWGVYPLVNSYFMTNKITTDLRFIVGPMWGMINRHRPDLKLTIDEKENSERTLQFWVADGAVLRFNNVGIETKYYKNKGGMQAEDKDRKKEALRSVYYLNKMYPKLTKISLSKKSGMPEIKMKGRI